MPAFDAVFDRVLSFSSTKEKPFVLLGGDDNAALQAFRLTLFKALKTYGPDCWDSPKFTPHITLLRDSHMVPEHPVEPVCLRVREFVLVRSLLRKTQHIHLARWPLLG